MSLSDEYYTTRNNSEHNHPKGCRITDISCRVRYTCGHKTCNQTELILLNNLCPESVKDELEAADEEILKRGFKLIGHMYYCSYCCDFHT